MIPFLDKTAVKLGLVTVLLLALMGFAKWGYDKIYEAGADSVRAEKAEEVVEVLIDEVENHNEDTISLQEHNRIVENAKATAKRNNSRVARVGDSVVCPVDEFERMWHETTFTRKGKDNLSE